MNVQFKDPFINYIGLIIFSVLYLLIFKLDEYFIL